ncbi:MAG TPA: FHA domain-containing protein [Candidatus Polarisedimenticolia bacterium]|jgi:hypothetical protein
MPDAPGPTGAYLVALTPESAAAFQAHEINIPHLPFRVGRESRRFKWTELGLVGERRTEAPPNNDLYLVEESEPMNVSREHFLIDRRAGGFFLLDRGSTCGTIVEGEVLGGGARPDEVLLKDHDVIIAGTSFSRYIFKFRIES